MFVWILDAPLKFFSDIAQWRQKNLVLDLISVEIVIVYDIEYGTNISKLRMESV